MQTSASFVAGHVEAASTLMRWFSWTCTLLHRPLTLSPEAEAHVCNDDTAPTKACFAALAFPDPAELPTLLMLSNAVLTAVFASAFVLIDSAAFWNSETQESLHKRTAKRL